MKYDKIYITNQADYATKMKNYNNPILFWKPTSVQLPTKGGKYAVTVKSQSKYWVKYEIGYLNYNPEEGEWGQYEIGEDGEPHFLPFKKGELKNVQGNIVKYGVIAWMEMIQPYWDGEKVEEEDGREFW